MASRLSFDHTPKLLASRHSGTTAIALFWSKRRHRAAVAIDDQATGEHFELEINPDDDALDLYDHPYAALWFPGYSERPLFSHPFARR
jgi:hypothetical protein